MRGNEHDFQEQLEAPLRLRRDLAQLFAAEVTVPPGVDETVLTEAKAGFARRVRFRRFAKWAAAAASAAAVVLISVRIGLDPTERGVTGVAATRLEDVNHDGRVDILDAFLVAKGIKAGSPQKAWDVNGDGVVDERDVQVVAQAAVKVGEGAVQ